MPMKNFRLLLVLMVVILPVSSSFSAEVKMGASFAYDYNFFSDISKNYFSCGCKDFVNNTGHGFTAGFSLGIDDVLPVFDQWILRFAYQNTRIANKYVSYSELIGPSEGTIIKAEISENLRIDFNAMSFDVMFKAELFESGFFFSAGPAFSYIYYNNMREWASVNAENVTWYNDSALKDGINFEGKIEKMEKFRVGAKFGFEYGFDMEEYCVCIGAFYNMELTNMNDLGWKNNKLQFAVDFLYKL